MKIRVISKNGQQEVLTLIGPTVVITETNRGELGMGHFTDASGTDHYFNEDDGTYDGWGRGCSPEVKTEQEASEIIGSIQSAREFVDPIIPE